MSYRILTTDEAHWRPSNQMGIANTNLAAQLEAQLVGARLWRLAPGQASTRPPELANTLEMSEEQLRYSYPDGPQAMPPEFSEPRGANEEDR